MQTPALNKIRERIAEATLELVRIPSVTGEEKDIAKFLERWARSQKQIARDDIIRLGNALIIGKSDKKRPTIALVGHIDTVPPQANAEAIGRDGSRIVGLGTTDMKGSIAVMQALFETLDLAQLPFALVLILYDREEGPYLENGLQPVLDQVEFLHHLDLAVVMEPTDNTLQLGCMGGVHARVTFVGQAAHSARPWEGQNAIHKAGPFLTALLARPFQEIDVNGLTFREALSVTLAQGGTARNVIPAKFELNVNYRFAPSAPIDLTMNRAIAEIHKLAGDAQVEIVDRAPPGPVPTHNPLLQHLRTLGDLSIRPKQAWTDVARFALCGVDAVNFGPGMGSQAHQITEWIDLDAQMLAYEVLWRFVSTPLESKNISQ